MKKAKVLVELGLDELIGTPFENFMSVLHLKKGTSIYCPIDEPLPVFYLLEGCVQFILFSPEGGEFFLELSPGEVAGVNMNLSLALQGKYGRNLEKEILAKENSILVGLPLDKLLDLELENKKVILEKILHLSVSEALDRYNYLFNKTIYTDEEFLIKTIEKYKILNYTTRELSETLNINIRTLQRKLLNLTRSGIIEKTHNTIKLVNQEKLDSYKLKFQR